MYFEAIKTIIAKEPLSVVAIIISLVTLFVYYLQYKGAIEVNTVNIEAEYCTDVFKKYLVEKIPESRIYLEYDGNGRLNAGYRKVTTVLKEFYKDIRYYFYRDKLFYRELSQELITLEELIMEERNKSCVSACEQDIFLQNIDKKFRKIYKMVLDKHKGKRHLLKKIREYIELRHLN